jgi:hypothetical protein
LTGRRAIASWGIVLALGVAGCASAELALTASDPYLRPWLAQATPDEILDLAPDALTRALPPSPDHGVVTTLRTDDPRWTVTQRAAGTLWLRHRPHALSIPDDVLVRLQPVGENWSLIQAKSFATIGAFRFRRERRNLRDLMQRLDAAFRARSIVARPADESVWPPPGPAR